MHSCFLSFSESMLNELVHIDMGSGFAQILTESLETYNPTANSYILNAMKDSVFAVGASLLTIFMLIELISLINRVDSNGITGLKIPANIFIKFGIFAFLFCNIPTILGGIEDIAVGLAGRLASSDYSVGVGVSADQVSAMADAIGDLGFIDRIFTYITLLICWLAVKLIRGIVQITAIFRLFELWIMLLFSPIPLSTFASSDFKQTAISFLKSFVAVSLKGAGIIACFVIYNSLVSSFIGDYDPSMDITEYMDGMLIQNILYAFALAISVLNAGKIVNRVMGV